MMRRLTFAMSAVVLMLVGAAPAARPDPAVPEIYEAKAEVGGIHASLAVPAYFEVFTPYSLSEASNGQSHGYHALGYAGFFLTAAAGQFGFPPPPGTAETLYPQGPAQMKAEVVPVQGAAFGESSGTSTATGAHGTATYGGGGFEGGGELGFGEASSEVNATATSVQSRASLRMQHLAFAGGVFTVGSVLANASATSRADGQKATNAGSVEMTDLRLLGVPVVLTPNGLQLAGTPAPALTTTPVDQLLAQAGLSIRRLPDTRETSSNGTLSRYDLGGIEVRFDQPAREFTVTYTIGRLRVRSRSVASAPTAGVDLGIGGGHPRPELPAAARAVPAPLATDPFALAQRPHAAATAPAVAPSSVRRVRRVSSPKAANWEPTFVVLASIVPLSLIARRALRAATAP